MKLKISRNSKAIIAIVLFIALLSKITVFKSNIENYFKNIDTPIKQENMINAYKYNQMKQTLESKPDTQNKQLFGLCFNKLEDSIENYLKRPDSAMFCLYKDYIVKDYTFYNKGNVGYIISGHVKSKNKYGAYVKVNFIAQMNANYNDFSCTLVDIAFDLDTN